MWLKDQSEKNILKLRKKLFFVMQIGTLAYLVGVLILDKQNHVISWKKAVKVGSIMSYQKEICTSEQFRLYLNLLISCLVFKFFSQD